MAQQAIGSLRASAACSAYPGRAVVSRSVLPRLRQALAGSAAGLALTAVSVLGGAGCGEPYDGEDFQTTAIMNGGDWRDEVIYQLVVDRFADGDLNNNHRVMYSALGRYQGGDWQGAIDHLDYLEQLGVTTLWISPIVKNIDYDASFDGYHGY